MSDETSLPVRTTLAATAKAAMAIAGLSLLAAGWLSHGGLDRSGISRLAAKASHAEPVVTGSITRAAAGTKLDPCTSRR